jgi:drug/metabolite transporter (DMT)-like permease
MALGGVFIFQERFVWGQWLGLLIIVVGLGLFFRDQLADGLVTGHNYLLGSAIVGAAALSWAAYALMQKQLLLKLSSQHILAVIYVFSALLLWPFAHPSALLNLDALHWALLLYCALNTLVAYGAFAEAMEHWQASRVSAVLATTPMLCLGVVAMVHALWPEAVASEHVGVLGFTGAALVVAGSALSSLLGQNKQEKQA